MYDLCNIIICELVKNNYKLKIIYYPIVNNLSLAHIIKNIFTSSTQCQGRRSVLKSVGGGGIQGKVEVAMGSRSLLGIWGH